MSSSNSSSNIDRTAVARDIFTYCTKEKTDTWHVVVAQNGQGIVDRVLCKSCGSQHNYRKQAVGSPNSTRNVILRKTPNAGPSAKAVAAANASAALDQTWFAGVKAWGDKPVTAFDPSKTFSAGDVFEHEVFGKGVVQTRRESRIDVLFRVGVKTLPSKA